jgi:hypothetical protein
MIIPFSFTLGRQTLHMKSVYTLISILFFFTAATQDKDEKEILDLLH